MGARRLGERIPLVHLDADGAAPDRREEIVGPLHELGAGVRVVCEARACDVEGGMRFRRKRSNGG